MHEPISLGVQRPQPPLPEITASTLNSRSLRMKSSFSLRTTPGPGHGPAEPISLRSNTFVPL